MVSYGEKAEYRFSIPNVDHQAELITDLRLTDTIYIFMAFVFSTWVFPLWLAVGFAAGLARFIIFMNRREKMGRPFLTSKTIIVWVTRLPVVVRESFFSSVAYVTVHHDRYRR